MSAHYVREILTQSVSGPVVEVREFYQDLTKLGRIHPLVVGVERLPDTEDGVREFHNYRVTDRMPLGPFGYRITYRVQSHLTAEGNLVVDAFQFPRVHVHNIVEFAPDGLGTMVVERLAFGAPRGLLSTVRRHGVAAHITMLANLRRQFDTAEMSGDR